MAVKALPPRALVRQLLRYDAGTGVLSWRHRPLHMFPDERACKSWNTNYAGLATGYPNKPGYLQVIIGGRRKYMAHRLAWLMHYGEPVPDRLDHIDGDPANNRITNLRAVTPGQNVTNSKVRSDNKLGIKGVWPHLGKFESAIQFEGRTYRIGRFATAEEAAEAYREAALRLHGKFARFD